MSTQKKRVLTIKEAAQLIDGLTEYASVRCVSGQLLALWQKKHPISEENLYKAVFGEDYAKGGDGLELFKCPYCVLYFWGNRNR